MKSRFFLSAAFAGALALCASAGAASLEPMVLPASADFAPGSYVLTETAQAQLDVVVAGLNVDKASVVVAGFANTADINQRWALASERARSVKAFFMLNGIDPDNILMEVDAGDADRPGQVQVFVNSNE